MRVVVATVAERTHFLGLVPLAWALRAAGHEVVVASQPELAGAVTGAGLPFAAVGEQRTMRSLFQGLRGLPQAEAAVAWGDERTWRVPWGALRVYYRQFVGMWWRMVNDPMADDLVGLCRAWRPDLVVWEPVTFSGAVAARACGAAHVRYLWGADIFARMRGLFLRRLAQAPRAEREDPMAGWLGGLAGRYGVDFDEELVVGQATVDQVPPALRLAVDPPVRYLPVRYVPYNGRAVVPAWLRTPPDRPRICLTLGTTTQERAPGEGLSYRTVLQWLAEMDVEVVATVPAGQRARLGTLPPNARLVDYVPLHALVSRCTAAINHGGWGTVLTSLEAGVPQLLVPSWFDNPMLARRLAAVGAALHAPPAEATEASMSGLLSRLLDDRALRRRAGELGEEAQTQPSPASAAAALGHLDGGRRPPVGAAELPGTQVRGGRTPTDGGPWLNR